MADALWMTAAFVAAAAVCAAATALALPRLRRLASRQHIREDVPETHLQKVGTPSLGGVPMLAGIIVAALGIGAAMGGVSARVIACLAAMVAFALIGLADDVRKLDDTKSKGILARYRIGAEALTALVFLLLVWSEGNGNSAAWLGTGGWAKWSAIIVGGLVMVGSANALNLTDGLDGLAAGLTAVAALALSVAALALGEIDVALLAAVIGGAAAGFLLLNSHPARVWMGDVGSLGLGAGLAAVAVAARVEFLFAIIGLVFVIEALSVILQVISFQSTGKRIFKMSPIHHHFELCGWEETRIVGTFWTVGACAAAVGLALLWVSCVGA